MTSEMNRRWSHEPESLDTELKRETPALNEAVRLTRMLSGTLHAAIPDPERQKAFRDLLAVIDSQLREERSAVQNRRHDRRLRSADDLQLQRGYEYFNLLPRARGHEENE